MKLNERKFNVRYRQMGGDMGGAQVDPAMAGQEPGMEPGTEAGAPAGGDPMEQLMQMAQAGASGDCEAAQATCQMLLQVMQGGGGAPQGGAPVFGKGGRLGDR